MKKLIPNKSNHKFLLTLVSVSFLLTVFGIQYFTQKDTITLKNPLVNILQKEVTLPDTLTVGKTEIIVEIAKTAKVRSLGLGGRESIDPLYGMLFVFDREDFYPPFWMKGMLIPIDFIWINDDRVVDVTENVLPPENNESDEDLPVIISKSPVDYVLEVESGFVQKHEIEIGDIVQINDNELNDEI